MQNFGGSPLLFRGEEGIGVLRVELQGFSNIGPSHGARGKLNAPAPIEEAMGPCKSEQEEEEDRHY